MTQDTPKELSLKLNMLWNSFGSLFYLGCQWLMTVLVVRFSNGFDAAGTLTLAMSVYNIFSSVALYRMYTYQVSDVRHENAVGEYFGFRIITCVIALGMAAIYSFATCPLDSVAAILAFFLYKIANLFIDVLHGLDQQHHRMDFIGKSLIIQGAMSLVVFCAVQTLANDLVVAFLCMTIGTALIGLLYDLPRSTRFEQLKIGISRKKTAHLLKYCFPIVVAAIACNAAPSLPRQILASIDGASSLGIYASVAAPATIIQMGASYIYNPLLGYFSEAYEKKDMKKLAALLLKASAAIAAISLIAAIALLLIGEPLLVFLFGDQIAPHVYLMTPIIICTAITAYVWFLNDILVAIRHFKGNFIGNVCAVILSVPAAFFLIPIYGMNGVSFATILAYGASAMVMLVYLLLVFRKESKHVE